MKKRLLLIDAYNLAYRSFYAIPSTLETSHNFPVNALYGFLKSFLAVVQKLQPDEVAVCLDAPAKTFRSHADASYKAQRKETPAALVVQLKELSERFLPLLKLAFFVKEGVEADDLIASISTQYGADKEVFILSNDRDVYQLLQQDHVAVINLGAATKELGIYTENDFIRDFGIKPSQYPFYKAMTGDSSDNLKGISGIGPKTARKIIQEHSTMDSLFEDTGKATLKLRQEKDTLKHQLMMVTMLNDVALSLKEEELRYPGINEEMLKNLAHTYEFHSLVRQFFPEEKAVPGDQISSKDLMQYPLAEAEFLFAGCCCFIHYEEKNALLYFYAPEKGLFHCQLDPQKPASEEESFLFDEKSPRKQIKSMLLRAERIKSYNIKSLFHVLKMEVAQAKLIPIDDLQLMFYLLYPNLRSYEFHDFQLHFHDQEQMHPIFRYESLYKLLEEQLEAQGLLKLYRELELPLLKVLYAMEHSGIKVSEKQLDELERLMKDQLENLQKDIYLKTGSEFNIASPKQLAFVLFEKLRLPVIKKTKTSYSTDSEVLDQLEPAHPCIADIKRHREISKLLSTYVKAFKNKKDKGHFLHTTFLQAGPSTGRISSIDPNLQNLPSDQDEVSSFSIRSVFLPSQEDEVFLAADYSQIDLRVMAHFSEDPHLIKAFLNEEDIHEQSARMIFHLKEKEIVTPAMRKTAKTVNFGVIYGMSSYALARSLKISEKEANEIIQRYFASYPKVRAFKEKTVQQAGKLSYVETLLHRRRAIPELGSHQKQLQQLGERLAVNTVIQGSSADIIKLAMIRLDQKLPDQFPARMLLQIHDELLWECRKSELAVLAALVRTEMEEAIQLKVPLKVHIKTGTRLNELQPYPA